MATSTLTQFLNYDHIESLARLDVENTVKCHSRCKASICCSCFSTGCSEHATVILDTDRRSCVCNTAGELGRH